MSDGETVGFLTTLLGFEVADIRRCFHRRGGDGAPAAPNCTEPSETPSPLPGPGWKLLGVSGAEWIPLTNESSKDVQLLDVFRTHAATSDALKQFVLKCETSLKSETKGADPLNFKLCIWDPRSEAAENGEGSWYFGRIPDDDHTITKRKITTASELVSATAAEDPPKYLFSRSNVEGVAKYILEKDCRKVLVMCGAGISVAAGIPDFRTPGTGLYAKLAKYNLPYPEAIFTLDYLRKSPADFVNVVNEMKLWPGTLDPTTIHLFLRLLQDEGRLLRCFTQNIDCLERAAGVDPDLLVEAHGSFASASCLDKQMCGAQADISEVQATMEKLEVPRCAKCGEIVKPDVVFFGESLPPRFFRKFEEDTKAADLLIVIGTSLKVYPFAAIVDRVGPEVPRVLINNQFVGDFVLPEVGMEVPGTLYRDCFLRGDGQTIVSDLVEKLGWSEKMASLKKDHQQS